MTSQPGKETNADQEYPAAPETGNASNPSPRGEEFEGPPAQQLLDPKAETYLREAGNIEDLPDPKEREEADRPRSDEKK